MKPLYKGVKKRLKKNKQVRTGLSDAPGPGRRASGDHEDDAFPEFRIGEDDVVNLQELDVASMNPVRSGTLTSPQRLAGVTAFFKQYNRAEAPAENAVASSRLAEKLGMADVISETMFYDFGHDDVGAVSVAAPGRSLIRVEYNDQPEAADLPDHLAKARGMLQRANGRWYARSHVVYTEVPLDRPVTQRGLSDLQVFDAITGQRDRHINNIFIDPVTGKVTGIDDDRSFSQGRRKTPLDEPYDFHPGLPSQVDARTAAAILAVLPEELPALLHRPGDPNPPPPLSAQAVKDAQARLATVQAWLQDDNAVPARTIIHNDAWNAQTFATSLAEAAQGTEPYITSLHGQLENARQQQPLGGLPTVLLPAPGAPAPGQPAPVPAQPGGPPPGPPPPVPAPPGGPPPGPPPPVPAPPGGPPPGPPPPVPGPPGGPPPGPPPPVPGPPVPAPGPQGGPRPGQLRPLPVPPPSSLLPLPPRMRPVPPTPAPRGAPPPGGPAPAPRPLPTVAPVPNVPPLNAPAPGGAPAPVGMAATGRSKRAVAMTTQELTDWKQQSQQQGDPPQ